MRYTARLSECRYTSAWARQGRLHITVAEDKMQKVSFELNGEFVELNQLLKLVGLCDSGGAGKQIVASGDVKVDGKKELRKTAKIRAGQQVRLGDVQISVVAA
jgi:ribosome-associated protein